MLVLRADATENCNSILQLAAASTAEDQPRKVVHVNHEALILRLMKLF